MNDSVFDKILSREIPATVVYEDEWALAFQDVAPCAPQHVLVIPKKKVTSLSEWAQASPIEVGEFMTRVALIAQKLDLPRDGYRMVINEGHYGQQTVPYLQVHLLGGRKFHWPPG
jgi:histidine triad (HIT) family protein